MKHPIGKVTYRESMSEMIADQRTVIARQRKVLVAAIVVAVLSWVAAGVLGVALVAVKHQIASAESDAARWKAQAGKAYTEMLAAKAGKTGQPIIPKGTTMECIMETRIEPQNGRAVAACDRFTLYPSKGY